MDIWTVVDKLNFKLDYSLLADVASLGQVDHADHADSSVNLPTFGKQLLQTLKHGKVEQQ